MALARQDPWTLCPRLHRASYSLYFRRSARHGRNRRGTPASEMEGHARHDDVRFEQQRTFDEERVLVVEEMVPDSLRHELRQDHGDITVRALGLHLLDVFEERLHQGSIRRVQHDQLNPLAPFGPLLLNGCGRRWIDVHVDRPNVVRQGSGVTKRLHDRPLDAANRHEDGMVRPRRRDASRARSIRSRRDRSAVWWLRTPRPAAESSR